MEREFWSLWNRRKLELNKEALPIHGRRAWTGLED